MTIGPFRHLKVSELHSVLLFSRGISMFAEEMSKKWEACSNLMARLGLEEHKDDGLPLSSPPNLCKIL